MTTTSQKLAEWLALPIVSGVALFQACDDGSFFDAAGIEWMVGRLDGRRVRRRMYENPAATFGKIVRDPTMPADEISFRDADSGREVGRIVGLEVTEFVPSTAAPLALAPGEIREIAPGDVLQLAPVDVLQLEQQLEEARQAKDGAYDERNQLVALLARLYPSGIARTPIEGWSPEWFGCVYIDLPTGQASWHYHDSQAHLFANLPAYGGAWDGHSTPAKYLRIAELVLEVDNALSVLMNPTADLDEAANAAGRLQAIQPGRAPLRVTLQQNVGLMRAGDGLTIDGPTVRVFRDDDAPALVRGVIAADVEPLTKEPKA